MQLPTAGVRIWPKCWTLPNIHEAEEGGEMEKRERSLKPKEDFEVNVYTFSNSDTLRSCPVQVWGLSALGGEGQVMTQRYGLVMWWVRIHSNGELSPSLFLNRFSLCCFSAGKIGKLCPI